MSSTSGSNQPYLLIFGATGRTGQDIVDGLLRVGGLRIGAISRSASTPVATRWKEQGIELRVADVNKESHEKLVEVLHGVDILVSVVAAEAIDSQRPLFAAAKEAGVKRVVPSEFATPADPGVMNLMDLKYGIRSYIQELGLNYTWIDVAWWKQLTLPLTAKYIEAMPFLSFLSIVHGDGKTPIAVTDRRIIGDFVGRIVKDERTLNKYVFIHEDSVTQEEVYKIIEEVAPADVAADVLKRKTVVTREENAQRIAAARESHVANPSIMTLLGLAMVEYDRSLYFRGDNTLAHAKELGALDARDLYPEVQVKTLRSYAEEYYNNPWDVINVGGPAVPL